MVFMAQKTPNRAQQDPSGDIEYFKYAEKPSANLTDFLTLKSYF